MTGQIIAFPVDRVRGASATDRTEPVATATEALADLVDLLDRAYQHARSRRARDELAQANAVLKQFAQAIGDIE